MATEVRELKTGDPTCRDIPYPGLLAPTEVDWIATEVSHDPSGAEITKTVTRKSWILHECHGCGYQWVCQHKECGDKTHGCTRGAV